MLSQFLKNSCFIFFFLLYNASYCRSQEINPYCYGYIMPAPSGEHKNRKVSINYCNKLAGSVGRKLPSGFTISNNPKPKNQPYSAGTTAIKVLKKTKHEVIVLISQWYGGTGNLTQVASFKKKGDILSFHKILVEGGDRCFGGIQDARFILSITKHKTPYGFLELFDKSTCGITYKDLSDCAVCCFGIAHYELEDIGKGKPVLTGFTFKRELSEENETQYSVPVLERCLAKEIKKMGFITDRKYLIREIKPLIDNFRKRCLAK